MKKIVFAALILALGASPAHAEPLTVERVNEYLAVCRAVNAAGLRGKALTDYVRAQWPTLDEAMENAGVCIAYSHGKIDGAREMADRIRDAQ